MSPEHVKRLGWDDRVSVAHAYTTRTDRRITGPGCLRVPDVASRESYVNDH